MKALLKIFVLRTTLILVFALGAMSVSNAQNSNYSVDYISIEDGLSQTSVISLFQDSRGYLWIGTQDGLNMYDGYDFEIFKNQPLDTSSISNNYIHSICEDSNGDLWIGTKYGLNKYIYQEGIFKQYLANPLLPDALPENEVYHVYIDKQGHLWVKTLNFLCKYLPEYDRFICYEHYNDIFNFVSEITNFALLEDSEEKLWVGTKDGLNFFDKSLELFKHYLHQPDDVTSLSNNRINTVYEDNQKNLWIGTREGLNKYNRRADAFDRYYISEQPGTDIINAMIEDRNGEFWIGTSAGIFLFDRAKEQFLPMNRFFGNEHIILASTVTSFTEDNAGNLWVGTLQGLFKIFRARRKFTLYNTDSQGNPLFSNNYIGSIFKDKDQRIWAGTWGAGLHVYNPMQDDVTRYRETNSQLSNNFVHYLFQDSNERLWIGTQNGVNFTDDYRNIKRLVGNQNAKLFKSNRVFGITEDSQGGIWFATRYGLHKLQGDSINSFFHNAQDSASIAANLVYCLEPHVEGGKVWVGTENGMNLINLQGESELHLKSESLPGCDNCISNSEVLSIYQDSLTGTLWIGTVSGLNRYYPKTGEIKVFTEKDGLPNNLIYAVLPGKSGELWLSTNRGLSRLNTNTLEFSDYDISDGLQDYEFNHGAAYKASDGELLFGGINGLNAFYPDSITKNSYIPPVVIGQVELVSMQNREKLRGELLDTLHIPYGTNLITIQFASLDFTEPEKNRYAYRLEGLENDWIDIGTRRYASFSNLPPGQYVFRVKGTNSDFVWNEDGAALPLIVETPIWRTKVAYILYVLVFFLSIYALVQWRTRNLRHMNYELREKQLIAHQVAKQKEELTIKNKSITDSITYAKRIQEALMPSHELFKKVVPESFILYQPKDIVSGDFYWVNRQGDKTFVAVVDCTGHGVPGAFMSIIGFELLRNITDVQGIDEADKILYEMNRGVAVTFGKENSNIRLRDGMDIALCVIDKQKQTLDYAGAFRPMYYIRDNKLEEIKGDRFSVGLMDEKEVKRVTKTTIPIKPGDVFYIFTDGYADQFGGPEGKKYKYRRFRHLLLTIHKLPMAQQAAYMERSLRDWQGEQEQVDDILIVGFEPHKILEA
ncbi:MAG: two-component regulator propeller domain-containing protein [Bacteroidales bacterium]